MAGSRTRFRSAFTFPWRGVNLQILTIIILPLTALLITITFVSISLHQEAMRSMVAERDERAARTAAYALGDHMNYRLLLIRNLSLRAAAGHEQPESILATSENFLPEFEGGLAFFGREGELLAASGDMDFWKGLVSSDPTWLNDPPQPVSAIRPSTSVTIHPSDKGMKVVVAVFDSPGGAVTAGAFSLESLADRTLDPAISLNERTSAFLLDADFRLIYHYGDLPLDRPLNTHPGVIEALSGQSGARFVVTEGVEQVVAYSPVIPPGWVLVLEEPWAAVTNPLLRTTGLAPLVLIPVLLLALVVLGFAAHQIVRPLQALESKAARLSWGDFEAIEEPVGGVGEIRHLQRELIHLAQKVQSAQKSLHGYIGAITTGQEEERRRLARELHDDTLQSLIALKQRVQLVHMGQKDETDASSLVEIENLTEETIKNLRRLTRALRPIYLEDLGLVASLEMLAQEMTQVTGFSVEFHSQGVERRLSPAEELALYRIAQEALSNVARHADAGHARVSIIFSPHSLTLEVDDDGKGFEVPKSPADFAPGGHFGLLGMYERAELIGAEMSIQSSLGAGVRIVARLNSGEVGLVCKS